MRRPGYGTDLAPRISSGTTSAARVNCASMTVFGQVPSLKNGRPIRRNRRTGKPFSARSDAAQRYIDDFVLQVPLRYRDLRLGGTSTPLRTIMTVFYSSWRSDLDLAIVYDCLQHAGIVTNDRWIREKFEFAEVDPKNPRVEITVEEM